MFTSVHLGRLVFSAARHCRLPSAPHRHHPRHHHLPQTLKKVSYSPSVSSTDVFDYLLTNTSYI